MEQPIRTANAYDRTCCCETPMTAKIMAWIKFGLSWLAIILIILEETKNADGMSALAFAIAAANLLCVGGALLVIYAASRDRPLFALPQLALSALIVLLVCIAVVAVLADPGAHDPDFAAKTEQQRQARLLSVSAGALAIICFDAALVWVIWRFWLQSGTRKRHQDLAAAASVEDGGLERREMSEGPDELPSYAEAVGEPNKGKA